MIRNAKTGRPPTAVEKSSPGTELTATDLLAFKREPVRKSKPFSFNWRDRCPGSSFVVPQNPDESYEAAVRRINCALAMWNGRVVKGSAKGPGVQRHSIRCSPDGYKLIRITVNLLR